jgi:hypothetical protein
MQEFSEGEPNEKNLSMRFTPLERLTSDLRNLESKWYDTISKEEIKLDEDFE